MALVLRSSSTTLVLRGARYFELVDLHQWSRAHREVEGPWLARWGTLFMEVSKCGSPCKESCVKLFGWRRLSSASLSWASSSLWPWLCSSDRATRTRRRVNLPKRMQECARAAG